MVLVANRCHYNVELVFLETVIVFFFQLLAFWKLLSFFSFSKSHIKPFIIFDSGPSRVAYHMTITGLLDSNPTLIGVKLFNIAHTMSFL